jgi:glycerol uptake facilitator protein
MGSNLFSEALGTFMLVALIGALFSKSVALAGPAPALGPFLVGAIVWLIGLALGGTTGFAINPARDLGPRIMHAILPIPGKGSSNWGYAIVPVLGGLIGGVIAGAFIKTFF